MAVAGNRTLYVADQGNDRVRAIAPNGVIRTIAGGGNIGSRGFVPTGTPARRARLSPYDVTIGPHRTLYIATGEQVLRLDRDGRLSVVLGSPRTWRHEGLAGLGGPAVDASADGANGIAFDRNGDLFIAGSNTKSLLVVTRDGRVHAAPGGHGLYPRGDAGLARTPAGGVDAMAESGLVRVGTNGIRTLRSFRHRPFLGIANFSPDGIGVGADGTVYLDTYAGNGFSNKTAIVAIHGRHARLLWERGG